MIPGAVTPDGQTLVYNMLIGPSGTTNYDLKTLSLTGTQTAATVLTSTPRRESNPELSPDGRWLAYESDESGRLEVYVRPFPSFDSGRWQISNSGARNPLWSRNGRELFFMAGGRMMAVPVSPGSVKEFTYGRPAELFSTAPFYIGNQPGRAAIIGRPYDVAPDGRFIFIKQPPGLAADAQTIVVVENWIDEVRQRLGR
jgi:hypothetical protein